MELPQVAGNLSSRLVVRRDPNLNNSLVGDGKSGKKAKGKGLCTRFQSDRQL